MKEKDNEIDAILQMLPREYYSVVSYMLKNNAEFKLLMYSAHRDFNKSIKKEPTSIKR